MFPHYYLHSAGTNYEQTIAIATLPALAEAGDVVCVYIPILNDGLVTPTLYFSLSLDISDTHVKIPEEKQSAIVQILPGKKLLPLSNYHFPDFSSTTHFTNKLKYQLGKLL